MTSVSQRIHAVDALRGFSLAGIVLVHMVENYIGGPTPAEGMEATNQGILDVIVNGFVFLFIRGKFFALFSFLFGLSFFIQMDRGAQKGGGFAGRFLWRLILLLIIGAGHHLFYRGDILTMYALLGIVLIPFYRMSVKWLSIIAGIIFLGVFRYVIFATVGANPMFTDIDMNPENPAIVAYFDLLKNGGLLEVFKSNTLQGHLMKLDFQFGVFARGYLTFGFFLLGLIAGKTGFFLKFTAWKKGLKNALLWSIAAFVMFIVLMGAGFAIASGGQPPNGFDNWWFMLAFTMMDLSNLAMTAVLVFGFLLIFLRAGGERFLMKFAPYGKMALTNYVAQTIIGTAILYGWGMGYLGELRNVYTFGIGLAIIIVQMTVSSWWLKHFLYGPLEWLWRSLTYFKLFPMKKRSS